MGLRFGRGGGGGARPTGYRKWTVVNVRYDLAETGVVTSTAPTNFLPNDTHQITYNALNVAGSPITPVTVTFVSSNTNFGTVNSTGLVTAVAAGSFNVTLTADNWISVIAYVTATPAPSVNSVSLSVTSGSLSAGQTASVVATALDSSGNALPGKTITVASADTNVVTVSPASGTSPFTATITAVATGGPTNVTFTSESKTAAYAATVTTITQVGYPYTGAGMVTSKDWNNYADKAALLGLFGVEGNLNNQAPVLSNTSFYDLISDSIFGKVVAYSGGTFLNTTSTSLPGRIAVHSVTLSNLTNVWVRQFVKFDPLWTNIGNTGGSGAASYKMMFLRYSDAGRHASIWNGSREWTLENPTNSGAASDAVPAWDNTPSLSISNGAGGGPDISPQVKVTAYTRPASEGGNLGASDGDGEWYQVIMHFKSNGTVGATTNARQRYTSGSAASVNPDTETIASTSTIIGKASGWNINARVRTLGVAFPTIVKYDMGVNRNRQWDSSMTVYWGPYEVVDGTVTADPFGIGSTWPSGGGV